jgi:hypothetical protein
MLDKKLKEALELLGGKAVVKDGESYYVVLTLPEFKKIRLGEVGNLTKQELVDKINNDIAIWKSAQEEEKVDSIILDEIEKNNSEEVVYEKAN